MWDTSLKDGLSEKKRTPCSFPSLKRAPGYRLEAFECVEPADMGLATSLSEEGGVRLENSIGFPFFFLFFELSSEGKMARRGGSNLFTTPPTIRKEEEKDPLTVTSLKGILLERDDELLEWTVLEGEAKDSLTDPSPSASPASVDR